MIVHKVHCSVILSEQCYWVSEQQRWWRDRSRMWKIWKRKSSKHRQNLWNFSWSFSSVLARSHSTRFSSLSFMTSLEGSSTCSWFYYRTSFFLSFLFTSCICRFLQGSATRYGFCSHSAAKLGLGRCRHHLCWVFHDHCHFPASAPIRLGSAASILAAHLDRLLDARFLPSLYSTANQLPKGFLQTAAERTVISSYLRWPFLAKHGHC